MREANAVWRKGVQADENQLMAERAAVEERNEVGAKKNTSFLRVVRLPFDAVLLAHLHTGQSVRVMAPCTTTETTVRLARTRYVLTLPPNAPPGMRDAFKSALFYAKKNNGPRDDHVMLRIVARTFFSASKKGCSKCRHSRRGCRACVDDFVPLKRTVRLR